MKSRKQNYDQLIHSSLMFVMMVIVLAYPVRIEAQPVPTTQNLNRELKIQTSSVTGQAIFITASNGLAIPVNQQLINANIQPMEFLNQYGYLFGLTNPLTQLTFQHKKTDALRHTHFTYQQVLNGVEVFSGLLKIHQNAQGEIIAANGDFYKIKDEINTRPTITQDQATTIASSSLDQGNPKLNQIKLVVVDPGWYGNPATGAHLAYHIILSDIQSGIHEAFFVDAHTGEILDHWSMIHTARYREVYDGENRTHLPGHLARVENDDPVEDLVDVDAAYDYLGDFYDYFFRAFGRDSLDDKGLPLTVTVNSAAIRCPNAFWTDTGLQAAFCTNTVTDDVVGHEMMHGLNDFTANLIFRNQSGQLNESYSDIFGELIDMFNGNTAFLDDEPDPPWPEHLTGPGLDEPNHRRTRCNKRNELPDGVRWMLVEDDTSFPGVLRDMWDPTCFNHPDRANSKFQQCSALDNGGVHSGSGIPNHAFAMLTDGKTFNGYTVVGIGPIKSAAVWYRALTTYLIISSDFIDAYAALNQSAFDLIGTFPLDPRTGLPSDSMFTAFDAQQVDKALLAVEMNTIGRCGRSIDVLSSNPPPPCLEKTILFKDDFENGNTGWSVSNTEPATPYDWIMTSSPLPQSRDGVAWFCADANFGDCVDQDEAAVHSLYSPEITIPEDENFPFVSFTHYMVSEFGWDGGTVKIKVNDTWTSIPERQFQFNPYNSLIRPASLRNTNPLADQLGWSGAGGDWGTSVIDLTGMVSGGDTIRFRFDFGKDGCVGLDGWYMDDFEVFTCTDCNNNNLSDSREFVFTNASGPIQGIGSQSEPLYLLLDPPFAKGDVNILITATADLAFVEENITIMINGTEVANLFELGAQDCPHTPDAASFILSAEEFNDFASLGYIAIRMMASEDVSSILCRASGFVKIFMQYNVKNIDINNNNVLDECEDCSLIVAPEPEPIVIQKNRYLSFIPDQSQFTTAIKITLIQAPVGMEDHIGTFWWADHPTILDDTTNEYTASLSCDPVSTNWRSVNLLHLFGQGIIPGATYVVETQPMHCMESATASIDEPHFLFIETPHWGDIVGSLKNDIPANLVDEQDIMVVLNMFEGTLNDFNILRADIHPAIPNQIIDILDILLVVDAYLGKDYPFEFPAVCN